MMRPSPPHCWQVLYWMVCPKKPLLTLLTWPLPLQEGQVLMSASLRAPLPLQLEQGTWRSMVTSLTQPLAISSSVRVTRVRMSRPR